MPFTPLERHIGPLRCILEFNACTCVYTFLAFVSFFLLLLIWMTFFSFSINVHAPSSVRISKYSLAKATKPIFIERASLRKAASLQVQWFNNSFIPTVPQDLWLI